MANDIEKSGQYFRELFPFWNELPDDDKELILRAVVSRKYKKGENIHGGNGECTGMIFVESGCLRVYMLSEEGREITLYRLNAGDFCTLSASCVIQSITFDVMVDAEEDSDCLILNGGVMSELSERDLRVKNFFLEAAVERFSDVMWVMQQILFMSFDKRLAIFLLDETAKTGGDVVHLSNEQIAKYMGSAREVVSRMMKYFTSEGIAERRRDGIHILDRAKLRRLAM